MTVAALLLEMCQISRVAGNVSDKSCLHVHGTLALEINHSCTKNHGINGERCF